MADGTKTLVAEANGGVTLTETSTNVNVKVDPTQVVAVTALSTTNYLLASVSGVLKKIFSPFIVDSSANVGIGMTPTVKLDVAGSIKTNGRLYSNSSLAGASGSLTDAQAKVLMYYLSAANWAGVGVDAAGSIWIRTGNSTGYEFWMTNGGQFGFGTPTVTAGYKAEFNGAIKATKVNCGSRVDHGVLASAPSGPAQGDHYFNSTDKFEYFYNGTEWKAAWA